MNVFVTGGIGSGKSTVVRTALGLLGWRQPRGYATHWGGGARGGELLYIQPWGGAAMPMARRQRCAAGPGGVPYELDEAVFLAAVRASLAGAAAGMPVVIDELGLIEAGAEEFDRLLSALFQGPAPVLAVVQRRALDHWLGKLARTGAEHVLEVDPASRAGLPARLAALYRG